MRFVCRYCSTLTFSIYNVGSKHLKLQYITDSYTKLGFFLTKPTDELIFPNLFLSRNSTSFGQSLCPSSGVLHCTCGTGICHAILMTYASAECTAENSWRWTGELPETCKVSSQNKFRKNCASAGFIKKKLITMHDHMNTNLGIFDTLSFCERKRRFQYTLLLYEHILVYITISCRNSMGGFLILQHFQA